MVTKNIQEKLKVEFYNLWFLCGRWLCNTELGFVCVCVCVNSIPVDSALWRDKHVLGQKVLDKQEIAFF